MATTYNLALLVRGLWPPNIFIIENIPPPLFPAHVYYDQTAGAIRIPLGTEVGLGSGDIVLDGDQAPINAKGHSSPQLFVPLLWPASLQARILPVSHIVD